MSIGVVNNFKWGTTYESKPPHLIEYLMLGDYTVYRSTFNPIAYIVYNSSDKLYYVFEDRGSKNLKKDLKESINQRFTHP